MRLAVKEDLASNEQLEYVFELCDVEIETLRRAAIHRGIPFDPKRRKYSGQELKRYGLVREGYNRSELRDRGIVPGVVSSLDSSTDEAMKRLPLETPYGEGIAKYELPIDMLPLRVAKTIFPPNSHVTKHIHPPHAEESPGGSLRIVVSGSIDYDGRTYGPGDWFFVPNGVAYEFHSDRNVDTVVFYKYAFFGVEDGNRFSHPYASS